MIGDSTPSINSKERVAPTLQMITLFRYANATLAHGRQVISPPIASARTLVAWDKPMP